MKPLSAAVFLKNNKKRVFPVFLTVLLSVALLFILQVMVNSTIYMTYLTYVEPQKHYSSILARTELIKPELVETVNSWDTVEKTIPWMFQYTYISTIIGDTGSKIMTVNRTDMDQLMSLFSLKLSAGRLPDAGKNEIALHSLVAANKGLKLGDKMGSKIKSNESLSGEYTIVGILEGNSLLSFSSLEYWTAEYNVKDRYSYGMIILPKKGCLESLNEKLSYLPFLGLDIRTFESVYKENTDTSSGGRLLLNLINITVIAIVSICTGFLCYIYFSQRRSEFGILNAIGYTRRQITGKTFIEIGSLSAAGLIAGLSVSVLSCILINRYIFMPRGQLLQLWNPDCTLSALCIPVFVTLSGIIPVWRMLNRLDPVEIIEGTT